MPNTSIASSRRPVGPTRHGLAVIFSIAASILLTLAETRRANAAGEGPPSIVLIMADDMGFSDIGCYGGEIATPTLDRLAANGLRFSQFYNNGRCCPTRASLLTGLYTHQTGVGHMTEDYRLPAYRGDLNRSSVTIAETLRPAGYRTYMSGKWHVTRYVGPDGPKHTWPLQRGFEKFYGTIAGSGSYFDPTTLCRGNTYITPENDPEYRTETFYYTDAISDNAVRFLRSHAEESPEKPFFLYVSYTAAHWPLHALPADIAKYRDKYSGGYAATRDARVERLKALGIYNQRWEVTPQAGDWDAVEDKGREAALMEVYAAMVDRMDQGIGRIVAELERQKRLENTVILYLQDNGGCAEDIGWTQPDPDAKYRPLGPNDLQRQKWPPMQTRNGRIVRMGPEVQPGPEDSYLAYERNWANVSNTPFRRYKHWVHEGGIATPLIAHWPAGISAKGGWNHSPTHIIDILATCVDVASANYPPRIEGHSIKPLDGISLRPTFSGRALERDEPIFWEHEGNRAVREGQWKLVAVHRGAWELYDMVADRTEMRDLADERPGLVRRLASQWDAWAARCGVVEFGSWRRNLRARAVSAVPEPEGGPAARPNILFIAVDDMNDWIGPLGGNPQARTPNLDRLARLGMIFTNAHTAASVCHPSRVAIMSGVRPSTSGITVNVFNEQPGPSWRQRAVLKNAVTLSQHFRNNGYRAVGGGKIYHSLQWWDGSENDPATWDDYFPEAHKPIPYQIRAPEAVTHPDSFFGHRFSMFAWGAIPEPDEKMSDHHVVDWTIGELAKKHDKPFFIACGIFRPHMPWEVPQKWFDLYPLNEIELPRNPPDDLADAWDHGRRAWHQFVLQNRQWKHVVQSYLASVSFADAEIGRLLDALEKSPHRDNTIVVLWSDHGMHIGEKENWEKFTVWEESTRVPLFVVAPGVTEPGSRCDRAASLLDIYPTLVHLTGTKPPENQLEGESLVPLLHDPRGDRRQPAITSYARAHSVRTDRWRYIYYDQADPFEELYDCLNDPGEHDNLAYDPAFRGELDRHRELLRRHARLDPPSGKPVPPKAYELLPDGRIRHKDFELLQSWVDRATEAHKRGETVKMIGESR